MRASSDAQERRGDQGSKRPHILRAAEDVDVVHEQLGVAGFPPGSGDQRHRSADGHHDAQLHRGGMVVGAHHVGQHMKHADVCGPHDAAGDTNGHHCRAHALADLDDRVVENIVDAHPLNIS